MAAFNAIYQEFFSAPFPARTTLIAAPPNPRFLIEIEAVAAL
jgi:enamine deaminase RidA (YjgF/YER057c/UK114 family)